MSTIEIKLNAIFSRSSSTTYKSWKNWTKVIQCSTGWTDSWNSNMWSRRCSKENQNNVTHFLYTSKNFHYRIKRNDTFSIRVGMSLSIPIHRHWLGLYRDSSVTRTVFDSIENRGDYWIYKDKRVFCVCVSFFLVVYWLSNSYLTCLPQRSLYI